MAQERYFQVLTQRVREDRYPSRDLLDRIEENASNEQLADYVELLVDKMHETRYPSKDIMDRIERLTPHIPPAAQSEQPDDTTIDEDNGTDDNGETE